MTLEDAMRLARSFFRDPFCRLFLFSLVSGNYSFGAPPEEIRIGNIGTRGIVFRDQVPGQITEYISRAGDVDEDGFADFLLLRRDREKDFEGEVYLVHGSRDLPASPTLEEIRERSTVFRRSAPRFKGSDIIWGTFPAGDMDRDGLDDFLISRSYGAPKTWT